eukprot:TRINITY_DN30332_c0_g1_i1.p1 TRINITY_DN30332_c0_g1~~TRINITY_DN30332_c0_g1_i1.p1  ORF type:complete len:122 (-),score=25.04 TRINITY_DN30332_c0_g1_i1:38-403(-)
MKFVAGAVLIVQLALAPSSATGAVATGSHLRKHAAQEPLLPIGEGAYQSGKAVAQRTTDSRKDCEQAKWADCYKAKGDYVDGHAEPTAKVSAPAPKSDASHYSRLSAAAAVMAAACAALWQ